MLAAQKVWNSVAQMAALLESRLADLLACNLVENSVVWKVDEMVEKWVVLKVVYLVASMD